MDKNLFFYELEGRGYIFQNKKWDEAKHVFEDDMLNMAWEMWSSAKHSVKAQAVPEGFVLVPKNPTHKMMEASWASLDAGSADEWWDVYEEVMKAAQAQTVPEGFVLVRKKDFESLGEFKDLYKRAIINAKKSKNQINWAHVAGLGVGSGRAVDLCKSLGIDPGATNMHVVIEAQEQSHD